MQKNSKSPSTKSAASVKKQEHKPNTLNYVYETQINEKTEQATIRIKYSITL